MKYLIWALLIYFAWRWYTSSKKLDTAHQSSPEAAQSAKAANGAETMVQCARCGVHLPASEALIGSGGAVFCCEDHLNGHSS